MNLNQTSEKREQPERFNPVTPQGTVTTSFRPTWKTFVGGILGIAAASSIGVFGVFGLATGGKFPDLVGATPTPAPVTKAEEREVIQKTTEEKIKDLVEEYVSTWNSGWIEGKRPEGIFSSRFLSVVNENKAKGDDIAQSFNSGTRIAGVRLDSFVLLSDQKALADATFHLQRTLTLGDWYSSGEEKPVEPDKKIVIERFVRYSFVLEESTAGNQIGKWQIAKQTWLEKTPARIKTFEDEGAEVLAIPEATTLFQDLRPSKEQLQPRYDGMCEMTSLGEWPAGNFYTAYQLELTDGSSRTYDQAKERLQKLMVRVDRLEFKATVDGVSQVDENSAFALVTYRMNFTPKGSQNAYTATWQDSDTWARSVATDTTPSGWYLLKTERKSSSSIGETYGY
jgi:hypothetical protein